MKYSDIQRAYIDTARRRETESGLVYAAVAGAAVMDIVLCLEDAGLQDRDISGPEDLAEVLAELRERLVEDRQRRRRLEMEQHAEVDGEVDRLVEETMARR